MFFTARIPLTLSVVVSLGAASCGGRVPPPASVDSLIVSENAPPSGAVRLGEIRASDGAGCGMLGKGGSHEAALRKLRLRARALGADFVHLTSVKEPYHDRQCAHRAFTFEGVAFRVSSSQPEPAPAQRKISAAPGADQGSCALSGRSTPEPASLALTARLIARAFTISIEPADPTRSAAISLLYDRTSQKLELVRSPTSDVLAAAAEPIHIDDALHDWRIVQPPGEIHVFLDGKRVLVAHFPNGVPKSSFHFEPNQLEIVRISP
jgi:hypothetical protein